MGFAILTLADNTQHMLEIGTSGRGRPHPAWGALPLVDPLPRRERASVWDAVGEAIIELSDISGVTLTRQQMLAFLDRTGLMEKIIDFGEVETQIRGNLADALSKELIGEPWPTNGDIQSGQVSMKAFATAVNAAAALAGYTVED
jgi:hypothetical protein